MCNHPAEIAFALSDTEAAALAAFIRRAGYAEFRECAESMDEAYMMLRAAEKLRDALRREGYA